MAVHVAIVTSPYDRLILDGAKTIECRLTRRPIPPFGCIIPGERVYFKRSSGPFFAVGVVDRIWTTDNLTPASLDDLRRRFNDRIHGTADYYNQRKTCRYATLIWLREVWPCSVHPRYRTRNMRAWYTLGDTADPQHASRRKLTLSGKFDITLTPGALRQSQVRISKVIDRFPAASLGGRRRDEAGEPVTLKLRGGDTITTDIVAHQKMFRWRGWRTWFERCGLQPGDRLRFTPIGPRAFEVHPLPAKSP